MEAAYPLLLAAGDIERFSIFASLMQKAPSFDFLSPGAALESLLLCGGKVARFLRQHVAWLSLVHIETARLLSEDGCQLTCGSSGANYGDALAGKVNVVLK